MEREWSTVGAPADEQFGLWEQAVNQAFVPVTVRPVHGAGFVSGVGVRRLGGVEIADITAPAQSVRRTSTQVTTSRGDAYFLNLPLSPGASVSQDGRAARLRPGEFVVVDGDRPFALDFTADFRQISLKIPTELVHARLATPQHATGVRVNADRGMGLVASTLIRAASDAAASLDRREARSLGEHLIDVVALSLGGLRPQAARPDGSLLLRAVLDETERHLGDPTLSAPFVADRVGISVRYLHRLFADHGPSFGRWVLARRLDLAHSDLIDVHRAHWSIARVARERGFADPSYFSRVFRSRFGQTPRELRTGAYYRREGSADSAT